MENYSPHTLEGLPNSFAVNQITSTLDGELWIDVYPRNKGPRPISRIVFPSYDAYRVINESYRLVMLDCDNIKPKENQVYTALNSRWLNWLEKESYETQDIEMLHHYLILEPEYTIEVISYDKPTVNLISDCRET